MTATPDLARCPSCGNYVDADDMTGGQCPVCAGPEPVDPWAGQFVGHGELTDSLLRVGEALAQRDQARRFTAAWQGESEAYREVVEALTHDFVANVTPLVHVVGPSSAPCLMDYCVRCSSGLDHPIHRTVAVIQAELQPDDAPDFDPGQVPASTGEQR